MKALSAGGAFFYGMQKNGPEGPAGSGFTGFGGGKQ